MAVCTLALCALCTTSIQADYEATDVKDGGAIVGTVRFEGKIPKRRKLKITSADKPCHVKPIPNDDLVVSKDGKIRWAVVSIKKIDQGKSFPQADPENPFVLDQRGCRFRPHLVVVPQSQPLKILNSDGVLHNVHLHAKKNEPFNRSMPGRVKELEVTFDRSERIRVGCDVHKWMGAWIVVTKHPYHTVTGKDGAFRLENVPPGTYTLQVWHEKLGKQEREIAVSPGADAVVDFVLKK
jgi:plastocyanin